MAAVTLATLKNRIKQRANLEHSGSEFVRDSELNQLINTSYEELYGTLVRGGLHVDESTSTITSTGATTPYLIAADLFAVLNVYRVENGQRIRLPRHDLRHRPSTTNLGYAQSYRVVGARIQFSPWPSSGQTYEVTYVPIPGALEEDTDIVDGVLGWEEYLVIDVALKLAIKEETDTRVLEAERARMLARIQEEAASVEMTESWVIGTGGGDIRGEGEYERRGFRGPITGYYRGSW